MNHPGAVEMKPLEGLVVLDLTHVLAGPYCTYQLGLLGAEIIKVEAPAGDMTRSWGGTPEQLSHRIGSGFVPQNAGKRSICLNLKTSKAQACAQKLAATVDIFVENFEGGTMAQFGLDYPTLAAANPGLIYLSISAFGRNGPMQIDPALMMLSRQPRATWPTIFAAMARSEPGVPCWIMQPACKPPRRFWPRFC